jgi:hypothetical protein
VAEFIAQELLDWKPRTMLKEGLVSTIAYFVIVASHAKDFSGCGLATRRDEKRHPALKHVAIPQQLNPAEFEELHKALIAEVASTGAREEDIVADLARPV